MSGIFNSNAFNSNAFNVGGVIPALADRDIALKMGSGTRPISLIMGEVATNETREVALVVRGSRAMALIMKDT